MKAENNTSHTEPQIWMLTTVTTVLHAKQLVLRLGHPVRREARSHIRPHLRGTASLIMHATTHLQNCSRTNNLCLQPS
jgi:hypothetical protein